MSKLLFKEHSYTYKELLTLHKKGVNLYQDGEVMDEWDYELCDIKELQGKMSKKYIGELISNNKRNLENGKFNNKILLEKYDKNTITKAEMYSLLENLRQEKIKPDYSMGKGYIIVNLNLIPENISDSDYGKFHKLLSFLSSNHYNRVSYKNEKAVKKSDISNFLGYSSVRNLNEYLRRIKKVNLIREQNFGGIKYLIINPAYAKKNMEIDSTIYKMFKRDLDRCLTKYQIRYLNMSDDSVEISSMTPIDEN